MKKVVVALVVLFIGLGNIKAQEKSALEKDAYKLVEIVSKPAFEPIVDQFSAMVKTDKVTEFKKEVEASYPELFESLSKIYSVEFTHEEIKGLIKFYQTDLGKKFAVKSGTMAQKGMMAGQAWGMKLQGIMTKFQ